MDRGLGQSSFVVFEQQLPRPRVLLDNFQHRPAFVGYKRVLSQCPGKQSHRLFDLTQPSFSKPLFVQRVATEQVVFQCPSRPDAKLRAALGLYPVTDGDDHIQVIKLRVVGFAVPGSYPEIPDN